MMKEEVKQNKNSQQKGEKNGKVNWRAVTIGGVTGILMGIPTKAFASLFGKTGEAITPDANPIEPISMPVASIDSEQSFASAFAEARENLGAGGVFEWRGQLYNTYTAEEWQEMSANEQDDFADKLKPHVTPDPIDDIIPGGGEDSLPPDDEPVPDGIGEGTLPPDDEPIPDEEETSVPEDDQPVPEDDQPVPEDDKPIPEDESVTGDDENPVPEDDSITEEDDVPVPEDEVHVDENDEPVAEEVDEEHEQDYSNDESVAEEDEPAITEEEQEMLEELDENTDSYVTSIDEVGNGMEDYMSSAVEPDPLA